MTSSSFTRAPVAALRPGGRRLPIYVWTAYGPGRIKCGIISGSDIRDAEARARSEHRLGSDWEVDVDVETLDPPPALLSRR